jgi:transposase-like protein
MKCVKVANAYLDPAMPRHKKTQPAAVAAPPAPSGFDYATFRQQAMARLAAGDTQLTGADSLLAPLLRDLMEGLLGGEAQAHVDQTRPNRRNGHTSKVVKTLQGPLPIRVPRDRDGSFAPQLLAKRETTLGAALDHKVLALYGLGLSYEAIRAHLAELYQLEVSAAALSTITDQVLPLLETWRSRPLASCYAYLWLDAIHFKVRQDGKVVSKAAYSVLGVDLQGHKDLLGLYVGDAESARFWLSVLTDLQSRGVQDVLIACIDNLKGFADAIETIFPQTDVQLCLVHQVRNSLRYVNQKDQAAVVAALKPIYQAPNLNAAEQARAAFTETWGAQYPLVVESWERNWTRLTGFFDYPPAIRRVVYTTNTVEGFHRQLRTVTKTKGAFTSETALLKLLYLVTQRLMAKWTRPLNNWPTTLQQLTLLFDQRVRRHQTQQL